MFRHNNVSRNEKSIPKPHGFQALFEKITACGSGEVRTPLMTTEGEEMEVRLGGLIADQIAWHGGMVLQARTLSSHILARCGAP